MISFNRLMDDKLAIKKRQPGNGPFNNACYFIVSAVPNAKSPTVRGLTFAIVGNKCDPATTEARPNGVSL